MKTALALVVALSFAGIASAQDDGTANGPRQFDAVSIKPSQLLGYRMMPGRFSALGVYLSDLISMSYEVPKERILLPESARLLRFSVEATMPDTTSPADFRAMLRSMLEERFSLRVTRELRQMPVLVLVKARQDGRLGSQLTRFD